MTTTNENSYHAPTKGMASTNTNGRQAPSDPTALTTQLVDRALAAFRDVMFTRLTGMDRATALVAEQLEKMTAETATEHDHLREDRHIEAAALKELIIEKISGLQSANEERFTGIVTQFAERDTRTDKAAQESRVSLDAALAAAKEAVSEQNKANALAIGKSEDATKERLDALGVLMTTSVGSLSDKIEDTKSRLDRGEGQKQGGVDSRTVLLTVVGLMIAGSALLARFMP